MFLWTKITHLGDTSLMAPAAFIVGLWLLVAKREQLLWWWCALLASAIVLVSLTKIAFIGWGLGIPTLDFTGISGHSTFAMAILPVMAFLVLQRTPQGIRTAGVLFGLILGLLVGISRLELQTHSLSEVIAGCGLGALVSLTFIWIACTVDRNILNRSLVVLSIPVLLAASFSQAAPTQRWFVHVALYASGHEQPFVRGNHQARPSASGGRHALLEAFRFQPHEPRVKSGGIPVSER